MNVSLSSKHLDVSIGDILELPSFSANNNWLVESMDTGIRQDLSLRRVADLSSSSAPTGDDTHSPSPPVSYGKPFVMMMDLPLIRENDVNQVQSHMAVFANPWAGRYGAFSSPAEEGFTRREIIDRQATIGVLKNPVERGCIGVWDYANSIEIELSAGTLQSVNPLNVFGGANTLCMEAGNGDIEVLQFANVQLQSDGSWVLSKLLRAQLGTELAMMAGAETGASIVLLNEAIYPINVSSNEVGLQQNWRVGPTQASLGSESYTDFAHVNNAVSRRLFSPVSLRASRNTNGDIDISWKRRGRINSDNWQITEIPLDALQENYRIRIYDETGIVLREIPSWSASVIYDNTGQIEDYGLLPETIECGVAQIGDDGLAGTENRTAFRF